MGAWEFIKVGEVREGTNLFIGLPDVGLVGAIASTFLVRTLKLDLKSFVDSDMMPPIILFHGSEPLMPLRIYGNDSITVLTSEVAVPVEAIPSLARDVVGWARENKVRMIVVLSGVPTPNRMEMERPGVYGAAVRREEREMLESKGVNLLKEGFVSGVYAAVLKECMKRGFPAIALLAESYANYPDPGAAASLLSRFEDIFGIKVDVKPLLEQEEELRLKLRELMKRTVEQMRRAGKEYEYTIPPIYA